MGGGPPSVWTGTTTRVASHVSIGFVARPLEHSRWDCKRPGRDSCGPGAPAGSAAGGERCMRPHTPAFQAHAAQLLYCGGWPCCTGACALSFVSGPLVGGEQSVCVVVCAPVCVCAAWRDLQACISLAWLQAYICVHGCSLFGAWRVSSPRSRACGPRHMTACALSWGTRPATSTAAFCDRQVHRCLLDPQTFSRSLVPVLVFAWTCKRAQPVLDSGVCWPGGLL